jgi:hypothetical protein
VEEDQDYIMLTVLSVLDAVEGRIGDYFIFVVLGLCLFAIYKKMYRMSVGFFILALGTVIIRVLIGSLF